jgi:hypothetical protein
VGSDRLSSDTLMKTAHAPLSDAQVAHPASPTLRFADAAGAQVELSLTFGTTEAPDHRGAVQTLTLSPTVDSAIMMPTVTYVRR